MELTNQPQYQGKKMPCSEFEKEENVRNSGDCKENQECPCNFVVWEIVVEDNLVPINNGPERRLILCEVDGHCFAAGKD